MPRQYPESKEIQPVKGEEGKIEPEKVDGPGSGSKKESVLKALRERQAKIKEREKCSLEQKKTGTKERRFDVMRKVIFEDDEMRVIAMFDTSSRRAALQAVEAVIPINSRRRRTKRNSDQCG